jgi:hypothetical protein
LVSAAVTRLDAESVIMSAATVPIESVFNIVCVLVRDVSDGFSRHRPGRLAHPWVVSSLQPGG